MGGFIDIIQVMNGNLSVFSCSTNYFYTIIFFMQFWLTERRYSASFWHFRICRRNWNPYANNLLSTLKGKLIEYNFFILFKVPTPTKLEPSLCHASLSLSMTQSHNSSWLYQVIWYNNYWNTVYSLPISPESLRLESYWFLTIIEGIKVS